MSRCRDFTFLFSHLELLAVLVPDGDVCFSSELKMYTYNWRGISLLIPPNTACPLEMRVRRVMLYIFATEHQFFFLIVNCKMHLTGFVLQHHYSRLIHAEHIVNYVLAVDMRRVQNSVQ